MTSLGFFFFISFRAIVEMHIFFEVCSVKSSLDVMVEFFRRAATSAAVVKAAPEAAPNLYNFRLRLFFFLDFFDRFTSKK